MTDASAEGGMSGLDGVQERTVAVHGRALSVMVMGPESAPPVLCLHGWLDNANSFVPLAKSMPGYRLLALDLPGHGLSDHQPPGVHYHQVDWVFDVVAAADALGLERFRLMGHSMGAAIAGLTAGTVPERVDKLVLLDGTGPRTMGADRIPEQIASIVAGEKSAAETPVKHRGAPFSAAVRARYSLARPLSKASAELLCQRGVTQVPGGVAFRHDRRLQRQLPAVLAEDAVRSFLARIACPVLLIEAADGILTDNAAVDARVAQIADLERVRVPGGHHVHMDAPGLVAGHVSPFLAAGRP